jgi:16S rRNA (guanine966-N2)-methyltransferase
MRVIAGAYKGRRLEAPTWPGLRPTSDKLRETLFNVLTTVISGANVMDGYAGTGAVGIEALSRGAAHVTFIDSDRRAIALVTRNLERCGIATGCDIIRADLSGTAVPPAKAPFDLVFLDPPYQLDPADVMQTVGGWLASDGLLIVEHDRRRTAPERVGGLARARELRSGDSTLSFYRPVASTQVPASAG